MGATVAEVGERALVARLRARVPPPPETVPLGMGDDAAVVELIRGELEVLTTDTLVEGVHFERRFCSPADIGRKALAVNTSDLAAMGAQPRLALLSMGLPASLTIEAFDGFLDGFLGAVREARMVLVGGNMTRSPGPWFIDVTAIGSAHRRRVLTRGGGRAGDELYVTGRLGAARAGLQWLRRHGGTQAPAADLTAGPMADAVRRYQAPEARVRIGVRVGRSRAASACMDLSDGLADAVTQVAEASHVGARVELAALPVHEAVEAVGPDGSPWQALLGGDDYELLFAVPARRRRAFLAAVGHGPGVGITRIGRLTPPAEGLRVARPDGSETPLPRGYEHFGG